MQKFLGRGRPHDRCGTRGLSAVMLRAIGQEIACHVGRSDRIGRGRENEGSCLRPRAYTDARGVLYHSTMLDPGVRYPPYSENERLRGLLARLS